MVDSEQLSGALRSLARFGVGPRLTERIASLEWGLRGLDRDSIGRPLELAHVDREVLAGALLVKDVSRQVDVIIHALGILQALPALLEDGEVVESMSLGAGNTGRAHDLETDRRIAEFKFIAWQGGPESIRQNGLFIDVFRLAEADTTKRRQMFVVGTHLPLKFLNGGRAIKSVLSRSSKAAEDFAALHGEGFVRVRDYWARVRDRVELVDVTSYVPALAGLPPDPVESTAF
jgi:hypothetical protein